MESVYNIIKNYELRSIHDEFSFSKQMQIASRNNLWRNKEALWTIISGAVDDAAKECFIKINNMVSEISDVETCNIHALKSIAKSVDADFLTKNLREDYNEDILKLINLFSVQKEILLNTNVYFHDSVINKIFGSLTLKSLDFGVDSVPIDLIINIKENIHHLKKIFQTNLLTSDSKLIDLLKDDLNDLKISDLKNSNDLSKLIDSLSNPDELHLTLLDSLKVLTLENIINFISSYKKDENLSEYTKQSLIVNNKLNYFYLLINIIKQNYYNLDKKTYMVTSYFDKDKNKEYDLSKLIFNIVGLLYSNNDLYYNEYVGFHFFKTIETKISNDKLKENYRYNKELKTFVVNQELKNEMSKDEFIANLTSYFSYDDALNFISINKITKYRQEFIDFAKYYADLIKELKIIKNDTQELEPNVIKINFSEYFEDDSLIKKLYGDNGIIFHITKLYVDECIHIKNLRNQLKNLIQQYTFIGTKRIATDIFHDFFVNNFAKRKSLNYISDDYILTGDNGIYNFDSVKRNLKELIYGSEIIPGSNIFEDDKFSVNVIEYYDTTTYLNIESELPLTYSKSVVTDYVDVISTYVDENYLITSSYVKKPVYSSSQIPCSVFIKDYNEKFWMNKNVFLNSETNLTESNAEDYIKYYSNYIEDVEKLSLDTFKEEYINTSLKPLLEKIWDMFALSGVSESELTSEFGLLYKEYIGNENGVNKYLNHLNKTFPTIAPINNIDNLIKTSEYDGDLLIFLAKHYYSNVVSKVKDGTIKMLNMYNCDSVPTDDWKQSHVTFNGYSTKYEYSDNKLLYSIKVNKLYKTNGPFVYKKLQDYIFSYYLDNNINLNEFLKEFHINDSIKFLYNFYLNENRNTNNDFLQKILLIYNTISKYEEDIYENCFTLFKKDKGDIYGKLFFRSYNMPISVPLMNMLDESYNIFKNLSNTDKLIFNEVFNNCIDFGFLNEIMWVYGKYESSYKLISFKYKSKNESIYIDESTLMYHSTIQDVDYLRSLNDFVGVFYDENNINFLLFDCYEALAQLSNDFQKNNIPKNNIIIDFDLKLLMISLNSDTLTLSKSEIYNNNTSLNKTPVPMFLKHLDTIDNFELKDDDRIWNVFINDENCYVTYKSLNCNVSYETFSYYFNYKTLNMLVQSINVNWNSDFNFIDINEIRNDMNFELNDAKDTIILRTDSTNGDLNLLIENINSFKSQVGINNLSDCYLKNSRFYSKISPLNIGYEFTDTFYEFLISEIIKKASNYYNTYKRSFELTFVEMKKIFESANVKHWMNTKKWLKSTTNNLNYTSHDLISSYSKIIEIISMMNNGLLKIKRTGQNTIFDITNDFYHKIPIIKSCCVNKLHVSLIFLNDSGKSFLVENSIDLDATCYINDEVEKYKKIGYGNEYQKTQYINWSGDETKGGTESFVIDVNKYIANKYQNYKFNNLNIIFNVCWHNNSQINTNNLYAIVSWNNLIEKYPIYLCGTNELSCETKSFEINIDMSNNNLTFDRSKLYPIIYVNYKNELEGFDGTPDLELGTINLSEREFNNLENEGWKKFSSKIYYLKDGNKIYYLLNDKNYILLKNNDDDLLKLYKRILSELIYYKENEEIIKISDISLDDLYFGCNYKDSRYSKTNVNLNYLVYLNPKYFKKFKNINYKVNGILHGDLLNLSYGITEGNK